MLQKRGYGNRAYTLIEITVGVLIVSIVILAGFQAYSGVLIGKIKLIESTDIQKEAFYFSEKFFEEIKKGGTIDYEEYFNRKMVNGSYVGTNLYSSGHYKWPTGFGNFGANGTVETTLYRAGHYYCRSGNGAANKMGTQGCVQAAYNTYDGLTPAGLQLGKKQRYGQYSYHFIDYNNNYDSDGGIPGNEDEDGFGNIIGDDDDEYLGLGPSAIDPSGAVKEVYLISADNKLRTYFRHTWKQDPGEPNLCNTITGASCRGVIEFLKLEGRDWGMDHMMSIVDTDGTQFDGIVDTWIIHSDFDGAANTVAGSTSKSYWQELFSEGISVTGVNFFIFPHKDGDHAWKEGDPSAGMAANLQMNMAPYLQIKMTLSPSYNARKGIKGKIPEVKINTTISLTKLYSR